MNKLKKSGIHLFISVCVLLTLALLTAVHAQPAATGQATSAPATSQRARYELTMPPGMVKVIVGERVAICDPADEAWVKEILTQTGPATRPSTMPSDLITSLNAKRNDIIKAMAGDLGLSDAAAINQQLDSSVIPALQKFQNFKPSIFLMPITRQKLLALVKGGWRNPQFYYNRAADDVSVNTNIAMSVDRPMDDYIVPAIADQSATIETRKDALKNELLQLELGVLQRVSSEAELTLQTELAKVIEKLAVAPISPLKPGQEWFGLGVEGVFSGKYLAMISGLSRDAITQAMTTPDPRNPIRSATIDLLHLTAPRDLNPQFVGPYIDAMRRKSVAVVTEFVRQAGEPAAAKAIAEIAKQKPADGEAMLKVIKDATGVDLTAAVRSQ
jgi:hypothetical protein